MDIKNRIRTKSQALSPHPQNIALWVITGLLIVIVLVSTTALIPPPDNQSMINRAKTPSPEPTLSETLEFTLTPTLTYQESSKRDFPMGNGQPVGLLVGAALLVLIVILGTLLIGPLSNNQKKP